MGKESSMAYDRAGQLQSTEEPYSSFGTGLRAAHVYTYFENVGTDFTRRRYWQTISYTENDKVVVYTNSVQHKECLIYCVPP